MALRSTWKGMLRMGVISIPVRTYSSSEVSARIQLNQLHRECGCRLKQQMTCPKCAKAVNGPDIIKGYEYEKDAYIPITQEELDAIQIESSHTLAIERFVKESEINPLYVERSDYLAPDGKDSLAAFAVVKEAMKGQVGLAKFAVRGRESLVALQPAGPGILLHVLKTTKEVRTMEQIEEFTTEAPVNRAELALVKQIVDMMHEDELDLSEFEDRYVESLRKVIEAKKNGQPIELPKPTAAASSVTNLLEAARQTLEMAANAKKKPVKANIKAAAATKKGKVA